MTAHPVRRLVLVRHAKSDYPWGVVDHDRPLSARGRRDAPAAGRWLDGHLIWPAEQPPVVLVSSATRAQQTWTAATRTLSPRWRDCQTRTEPRIYEANVRTLVDVIAGEDGDRHTVLIVGHNPGLVELVHHLTDGGSDAVSAIGKFPTSGIAVLSCREGWSIATAVPGEFDLIEAAVPRG